MNALTAPLSAARVRRGLVFALPALVLLLISCQLVATPAAAPPAPAATQAPPTAASSPAVQIAPTLSASATAKPAPTLPVLATQTTQPASPPARALDEAGPWLLVGASTGLWAANPDGSGLTRLTETPILGPHLLSTAVSPDGRTVAYITGSEDRLHDLALYTLTLPDGQPHLVTALTGPRSQPGSDAMPGDPAVEAARAMLDLDSLAWSPDGQTLAFIGAMDGPSADLYTYTPAGGKITRLTDGPSQGHSPSWSPDGKYILHFGAEGFGTGAGFAMNGAWAARADGSGVIDLGRPASSGEELVGWLDAASFVVYSWTPACGPRNLRLVDIAGGAPVTLVEGCFSGAAMSPLGDLLITAGLGSALRGVYHMDLKNGGSFTRVSSEDAGGVLTLPGSPEFLVFQDAGRLVYANTGQQMAASPASGCAPGWDVAAYGLIYAWTCREGRPGVWINGPGLDERQVFDRPAAQPAFAADNTLLFFSGSTLYAAPFLDYTPVAAGQIEGEVLDVAWVREE